MILVVKKTESSKTKKNKRNLRYFKAGKKNKIVEKINLEMHNKKDKLDNFNTNS